MYRSVVFYLITLCVGFVAGALYMWAVKEREFKSMLPLNRRKDVGIGAAYALRCCQLAGAAPDDRVQIAISSGAIADWVLQGHDHELTKEEADKILWA
jgi:hypothetical protein